MGFLQIAESGSLMASFLSMGAVDDDPIACWCEAKPIIMAEQDALAWWQKQTDDDPLKRIAVWVHSAPGEFGLIIWQQEETKADCFMFMCLA